LTDFSYLRATTFDCAVLEGAALRNVTDAFTRKHLYMAAIAANLWRVPGLENINLWPLSTAVRQLCRRRLRARPIVPAA